MTMARITKPLLTPRLRYMLRKTERAQIKFDPAKIVVEHDENDPNRLNVLFEPEFFPYMRLLMRVTRQRIAIYRARSRKRL